MASQSHRRSSSAPAINIELEQKAELEGEYSPKDTSQTAPGAQQHFSRIRRAREPHERRPESHSHKRKRHGRSPRVEWKEKWTADSFRNGRVLILDYVSRDFSEDGRRQVMTNEFHDIDQLRRFYSHDSPRRTPALRLIHVQNSWWARRFLLRKFNIDPTDNLIGTNFGKWAAFGAPQRRAGKPILNGKAFRTQHDPWRGISRCAFGMDYFKCYGAGTCPPGKDIYKTMELNGFDDRGDSMYLNDVYAQRLSVYVQKHDADLKAPRDLDLRNPYSVAQAQEQDSMKRRYSEIAREQGTDDYFPILKSLDNGTTVIIFEDSQSGSVSDTLIGAREEAETRWRRLTIHLPKEELSEEELSLECINLILNDVFKALTNMWEKYLHKSGDHVSILEDKIYEQPADESRAPELWLNSSTWLKVERLVYTHQDVVKEVKVHLRSLFEADPDPSEWLGSSLEDFERIEHLVSDDLVKPTAALSDLMYKSVEIRDSRHSLQLGTSMWRLSWITFIFLPLTFLVSFFGMNVDTFEQMPSIKWWFIAAVPMMVIVIVLWYVLKHMLARSRQDPLLRGTYEHLFHELATEHPSLWSRNGPRDYVEPKGRRSAWKWYLLSRWFHPSKTIATRGYDQGTDGMGAWARTKRYLVLRWLPEIDIEANSTGLEGTELQDSGELEGVNGDLGAISDALKLANSVAMADAEPDIAHQLSPPSSVRRSRVSRSESPKPRPISEGSSGGCIVDEEPTGSGSGGETDGELTQADSNGDSGARGNGLERIRSPLLAVPRRLGLGGSAA